MAQDTAPGTGQPAEAPYDPIPKILPFVEQQNGSRGDFDRFGPQYLYNEYLMSTVRFGRRRWLQTISVTAPWSAAACTVLFLMFALFCVHSRGRRVGLMSQMRRLAQLPRLHEEGGSGNSSEMVHQCAQLSSWSPPAPAGAFPWAYSDLVGSSSQDLASEAPGPSAGSVAPAMLHGLAYQQEVFLPQGHLASKFSNSVPFPGVMMWGRSSGPTNDQGQSVPTVNSASTQHHGSGVPSAGPWGYQSGSMMPQPGAPGGNIQDAYFADDQGQSVSTANSASAVHHGRGVPSANPWGYQSGSMMPQPGAPGDTKQSSYFGPPKPPDPRNSPVQMANYLERLEDGNAIAPLALYLAQSTRQLEWSGHASSSFSSSQGGPDSPDLFSVPPTTEVPGQSLINTHPEWPQQVGQVWMPGSPTSSTVTSAMSSSPASSSDSSAVLLGPGGVQGVPYWALPTSVAVNLSSSVAVNISSTPGEWAGGQTGNPSAATVSDPLLVPDPWSAQSPERLEDAGAASGFHEAQLSLSGYLSDSPSSSEQLDTIEEFPSETNSASSLLITAAPAATEGTGPPTPPQGSAAGQGGLALANESEEVNGSAAPNGSNGVEQGSSQMMERTVKLLRLYSDARKILLTKALAYLEEHSLEVFPPTRLPALAPDAKLTKIGKKKPSKRKPVVDLMRVLRSFKRLLDLKQLVQVDAELLVILHEKVCELANKEEALTGDVEQASLTSTTNRLGFRFMVLDALFRSSLVVGHALNPEAFPQAVAAKMATACAHLDGALGEKDSKRYALAKDLKLALAIYEQGTAPDAAKVFDLKRRLLASSLTTEFFDGVNWDPWRSEIADFALKAFKDRKSPHK